MIAVIKGDIIASRKLTNQALWLTPLKELLSTWGTSPQNWLLLSGDFFQLEVTNPDEALQKVFEIKALIKKLQGAEGKTISPVDVRLAVGIGEKTFSGESIAEHNGPAFIYSSEKFDLLKKENVTMGIRTASESFDEEMNLYLRLAGTIMDNWSVSSAELMQIILKEPHITQEEIGRQLGIRQNSVSGRWNRAHVEEVLEVERIFRKKIQNQLP